MNNVSFATVLRTYSLKVTPQRLAVLEAIHALKNHPTAEKITEFIRKNNPGIATGTVYKTLETLVRFGIIRKVKTDRDTMRYDVETERHHHLYCADSDRIEDYYDPQLSSMIDSYLNKKGIPGFSIEDVRLQINGRFTDKNQSPEKSAINKDAG